MKVDETWGGEQSLDGVADMLAEDYHSCLSRDEGPGKCMDKGAMKPINLSDIYL